MVMRIEISAHKDAGSVHTRCRARINTSKIRELKGRILSGLGFSLFLLFFGAANGAIG